MDTGVKLLGHTAVDTTDTDRHSLRRTVVVVGMGIALRLSLVGELAVVVTATTTAVMEAATAMEVVAMEVAAAMVAAAVAVMEAEAMEAATAMEVVAMEVAAATVVAAAVATEGHHRRWARGG
jgi:hypothetical protein